MIYFLKRAQLFYGRRREGLLMKQKNDYSSWFTLLLCFLLLKTLARYKHLASLLAAENALEHTTNFLLLTLTYFCRA